jgi:hypothetical protein
MYGREQIQRYKNTGPNVYNEGRINEIKSNAFSEKLKKGIILSSLSG